MNISQLTDSKYQNVVYPLSKLEYEQLKESIKLAGGAHVPVIININNIVLDGHHRIKACRELSIEDIEVVVKSFNDESEELQFVISTNLERRQLNAYQKVELFAKLREIEAEASKTRQKKGTLASNDSRVGKTSEIVAKQAGLSIKTYERGEYVRKHATEENKQSLRAGELSIGDCYNYYQRQQKRQELQAQVIKKNNSLIINNEQVPHLAEAEASNHFQLIHGDFREKCKGIPDNSIALILADPPWSRDNLLLYKDLGEVAGRILVDGGSLVTMYNQLYPMEVLFYLEAARAGLRYNWTFALIHAGGTGSYHSSQVRVKWKPLLWFVKGDKLRIPDYIEDVIIGTKPDKSVDRWAQSPAEASYIVERLTVEGDTVLDPMMGRMGTTGIAALRLSRKFIGIELDEDNYNKAQVNINKK